MSAVARRAAQTALLSFHDLLLGQHAEQFEDRAALIGVGGGAASWRDLARRAQGMERQLGVLAGRRVGLPFRLTPNLLGALALLDRLDCDVFLMDGELPRDQVMALATGLRLAAVVLDRSGGGGAGSDLSRPELVLLPGGLAGSGRSTVTILTSGTTGQPKAARHSWASLMRPVRLGAGAAAPRWLMTYRPHLYAGLQVMLQCLGNGGTLVAPGADAAPAAIAQLMRAAGVQYVSATPSYWRRLLLFADAQVLQAAPLAQITLGGEVVDQPILDALGRLYPAARLAHIYATTELGRCFSVTDGQAGFPARYLREPTPDGVTLWIINGELMVRSANAMERYVQTGTPADDPQITTRPDRGFATGDLVEVVDDRVFFVGRRTDMINVGGNKVHPIEVERVIRSVPGVADVRVFAKRSSIAGELVVCQVVAAPGADGAELRGAIASRCAASLTPAQRPRLVDFVATIDLTPSGKTRRSGAP